MAHAAPPEGSPADERPSAFDADPAAPPVQADAAPTAVDAPTGKRRRALRTARAEADGLYVEFGQGVTMTSDDASFKLTLRGRVQSRFLAASDHADAAPLDLAFAIRRARLALIGNLGEHDIELYVQLGFAPDDMEPDRMIPLRDAVILWTRHRDLSVRFGQMKVNFSRERMISSSALQLVDRSLVNAELSLDRDVGVQLFSNDLFGWGERLAYQVGVYGGDGRNRARLGPGLLYAARVQVNPFGHFEDLFFEADLSRSRQLRLSLGLAGGLNHDTVRARSTHGPVVSTPADTQHLAADLLLKISGLSIQAEALLRRSTARGSGSDPALSARAARGAFVQSGYVFPQGLELSGRWAAVQPTGEPVASSPRTEVAGGLGWYMQRHELKFQADYTHGIGRLYEPVTPIAPRDHTVRVQAQVFF